MFEDDLTVYDSLDNYQLESNKLLASNSKYEKVTNRILKNENNRKNNYLNKFRDKYGNRINPVNGDSNNPVIPNSIQKDFLLRKGNRVTTKTYSKRELKQRMVDGGTKDRLTGFNSDRTIRNTKLNPKTKTFVPRDVTNNVLTDIPFLDIEDITVKFIDSLSDSLIWNLVENITLKKGKMFSQLKEGTRMNAKALERLTTRYTKVINEYDNNAQGLKMLTELADKEPANYLANMANKGINKRIKAEKLAVRAKFATCYLYGNNPESAKENPVKWVIVSQTGNRTVYLSDAGKKDFLAGKVIPSQRKGSRDYHFSEFGNCTIYPSNIYDKRMDEKDNNRKTVLARLMNEGKLSEIEAKNHPDYLAI